MNMHLPQSVEASTELHEIAAVSKQMISPRLSKPLISIVQDTLVGVNRLTRPTEFFTLREFMNLLVHSKRWDGRVPPPAKTEPVPMWSGQQVVSTLLPPVHLEMGNKVWDKKDRASDNYIIIKNGVLEQGVLDGDIFDKALIHILYNDFSPEATVDFIDGLQAVVATYLQNSGFSVGLSDLVADATTLGRIASESDAAKRTVESIQLQVHSGLFDNTSGRTNQEEFESKVFNALNKLTDTAGKIGLESLTTSNRMVNMVKCGSKGQNVNIAQMISMLGQQAIDNKRIGYGFQDRTLPHFKRYDDGAAARGYIENSFVKGLKPHEFFFHAMAGREGLIDTAVKTADSGYMQRQLVKTMEDLTAQYDSSVRDAEGLIVQFAYGDDGTSATKIENQGIDLGRMTDADIAARFAVPDVDAERSQQFLAAVFADRDLLVNKVWNQRVETSVQSAVHLARLLANAVVQHGLVSRESAGGPPVVSGTHVLDTIDRILARTRASNRLWGALVRYALNPQDIQRRGFTRAALDWTAEHIIIKHMKSWVVPGEMSGIIAAQSIGEPTTQMSEPSGTVITVRKCKKSEGHSTGVPGSGDYYTGPIGPFVDTLLSKGTPRTTGHGPDSVVMDLAEDEAWAILGVGNDEKASWRPISQLSRHPANGNLVRVHTKSGRVTTATLSHSFLRRTTSGIAEIKGADLRVGHRIPVATRQPECPDALTTYKGWALTREFGWIVGIYLADGCFNGNLVKISKVNPIVEERVRAFALGKIDRVTVRHYTGQFGPCKDTIAHSKELKEVLLDLCDTGSHAKHLGAPVFAANREFIAGLLSGYFDGDGNINVSRQQIRVGSRSERLIRDIARLLPVCGVFGSICEERTVRMPGQIMYTLNVLRKFAGAFQSEIGLYTPDKAAALATIVEYNERESQHSMREDLDLIPELGPVIAETGLLLAMPGQSRTYGRYAKKSAVGRRTLQKYIAEFEAAAGAATAEGTKVAENIAILKSAANSDVLWDEITALDILPDPMEPVYDFTVPGNDSFMVDDSIFVHNTLNTFHLSGYAAKSAMTRGVPRLKELLKVTQNPKATSLTIFLRPDIRASKETARRLAQDLEFTMLKDLVVTSRIYYDPRDSDSLVAEDKDWLSFFAEFEQQLRAPGDEDEDDTAAKPSPWVVRFELDREKMFHKSITMEDIKSLIKYAFNDDVPVAYTDHNAPRLVLRARLVRQKAKKGTQTLDDLSQVKLLQNKLLTQMLVRGMPGLRAVTFRKLEDSENVYEKSEETGKYEPSQQFVLDTFGSNFLDVLIHPEVDGSKLMSNHVHDVYENLGIEAARQVLFREIFTIFEQQAQVNYRHVALLCDAMTNRGRLMPADRYGVNKKKTGPLAKASFEQTEEIMLRAAEFGEMDPVTGVSANIMTGQPIRGGTGFAHVLLDEEAMAQFLTEAPLTEPRRLAPRRVDTEAAAAPVPGCSTEELLLRAVLPRASTEAPMAALPDLEIAVVEEDE